MGFWDSLGKEVGKSIKSGLDNLVESANQVTNLREEMKNYSESELRTLYKSAKRSGNRELKVAAKSILESRYHYEKWQFDGLDFE